jgi:hypothetical protein
MKLEQAQGLTGLKKPPCHHQHEEKKREEELLALQRWWWWSQPQPIVPEPPQPLLGSTLRAVRDLQQALVCEVQDWFLFRWFSQMCQLRAALRRL